MQDNNSTLILCASSRLAHQLRLAQQSSHIANGDVQWQSANIQTLPQWLTYYTNYALLAGDIKADYFSANTLNEFTEAMLWQQAIESCLAKHEYADLFDVPSLARAAIAANKMLIDWQIAEADINQAYSSAETRQFLRWRNTFFKLCEQHQTVTPAWRLQQQVIAIERANYPLPKHIELVGFDRITPLEQRCLDILRARGVQVQQRHLQVSHPQLAQIGLADVNAECRAAVAWAKAHLEQHPHSQLAIVSPIQGNVRRLLADLLDDTFHPETIGLNIGHTHQYEAPRIYDFSIGVMLSETVICRSALNLLRVAVSHQAHTQAEISALLLDVYWSDLTELDARSMLDARMRKKLMRTFKWQQLIDLTKDNPALAALNEHLQVMQDVPNSWPQKQAPSRWGQAFSALLQQLNWAQTRALSSHEYQAKQAWETLFNNFAGLDSLLGNISISEAFYQCSQLARNKMFMPEAVGDTRIQLLGMLENLSQPIDAIWVMGMNDHLWPPPADLNPLLPASLQRDLQTPGANPETQASFAQLVHQRLCNSAREVVFSWSHKEGERELRVSPLLADIPSLTDAPLVPTLAEILALPQTMQLLPDSIAPAVLDDEKPRGGSQLLAAQAICPAWAFYQYRLGALALEDPSDGLDSMVRGNLVHAVLQHFWQACGNLQTLKSYTADKLASQIQSAIEHAMQALKHQHPAQLMRIEQHRLQQLVHAWLALEIERDNFSVEACEAVYPIEIAGLAIECRIDRIDTLDDDSLVIIDYKTGSSDPQLKSWASARIKEPQLPLYASIALKDHQVMAVCFAKVHVEACKMTGLSQTEGLPGITPFEKLKSNSTFKSFDHMSGLIKHWQASLENIANEIRQGQAGVVFENENDLLFCGVKPLLRLPERQLQFEMQRMQQVKAS